VEIEREDGENSQKEESPQQRYKIRLRDLALEGTLRVCEPVKSTIGDQSSHQFLDKRCVQALKAHATAKTFSDFPTRPNEVKRLLRHPLVRELHQTLLKLDLPTVVLSISGGVDSTTHLALLWAVKKISNFRLAALHITNRSGVGKTGSWVAHSCASLEVPLYVFRSPLRRPRGGVDTGLTRNEYERAATKARFCMYKQVASNVGYSTSG